jgi:hypothetical protein
VISAGRRRTIDSTEQMLPEIRDGLAIAGEHRYRKIELAVLGNLAPALTGLGHHEAALTASSEAVALIEVVEARSSLAPIR